MDGNFKINDEPVLTDTIGHYELIGYLVETLLECDPPYVVGVSGSWGAGKTSFLRKIWAVMGGDFAINDREKQRVDCCAEMFLPNRYKELRKQWFEKHNPGEAYKESKKHGFDNWKVIWFNPWQHQFESNPLIALLNEIRAQYSFTQKAGKNIKKTTNVTAETLLDMLANAANSWSLGKLGADKIRQHGERYENQHYETPLTSQTFAKFFEEAVKAIVGDKGRLLICIDDLDRCEGDVAFRLLESLKLYLNVNNCIYILGMDQPHLEQNLASHTSSSRTARDYLDKILQDRFILPVPSDMASYLKLLLAERKIMQNNGDLFQGVNQNQLIEVLNRNLPHNPRKIKLFFAAWERYLKLIKPQWLRASVATATPSKDWRITVILCYLAVYEEPIYRCIELAPEQFLNELVDFVNGGTVNSPLYADLSLPPDMPMTASVNDSDNPKCYLWIARLVEELRAQPQLLNAASIRFHLIDSLK